MRKPNYIKTEIECDESYAGEPLETKIAKMVQGGEPIESISPTIFTLRKDGVRPEFDVRADKWDIAQTAMEQVANKYQEARKQNILKFTPKKEEKTDIA